LKTQRYGNWLPYVEPDTYHATMVASMVAGTSLGVCQSGKVTLIGV
jgi:hypothetical protein